MVKEEHKRSSSLSNFKIEAHFQINGERKNSHATNENDNNTSGSRAGSRVTPDDTSEKPLDHVSKVKLAIWKSAKEI